MAEEFDDSQFYLYHPHNWDFDETAIVNGYDYKVPVVSCVGNGPTGPKGDTFTYEDLSDEQIRTIGEMAIAAGAKGDPGPDGPPGPQGEPLLFTDLTEEELQSIYENISYVGSIAKYGTYVTLTDNESSVTIPIDDYQPDDILFITIDGVSMVEGIDYTILDDVVTFFEPIPDAGTKICFKAIGYNIPDGDKNITINYAADIVSISNAEIDIIAV